MIKDSLVKWYLTWVFIAYSLNNLVKWYLTRLLKRLTKDVAKKNSYKTTSVNSRRLRVQRLAAATHSRVKYHLSRVFELGILKI